MIGGAEDANERFHDKDRKDHAGNLEKDGSIHGEGRCDLLRSNKKAGRGSGHTKAAQRVCRHERAGRPLRKKEYRTADTNRWACKGVKEGMSSSKTQTRTIRIKNETADFFRDKPLNKVVENVHDLAMKKDIEVYENGKISILSGR